MVKMHALFSRTLLVGKVVSQQCEQCIFRCVAHAAHFFICANFTYLVIRPYERRLIMNNQQMMELLESLYEKSINGIPKVSVPIEKLAEDYLQKSDNVEKAAKKLNKYQIAKCATSGFLTSFGGVLTLPVTILANIGSVTYVQMRMIACMAYMGGYDINSDQVQTLVYACLAGISLDQIIKRAGIQFGENLQWLWSKKFRERR